MRLIANGSAVIEDIEDYARVHEMFSLLQSSNRRYNQLAEGWGSSDANASTLNDPGRPDPIPANSARTVVVKLMSSFLSQHKKIPLNMVPLVLELEIGDADSAFEGTGNQWYLSRPRLIGDVLTIDNSLQNS
jgi:hypothetical protein